MRFLPDGRLAPRQIVAALLIALLLAFLHAPAVAMSQARTPSPASVSASSRGNHAALSASEVISHPDAPSLPFLRFVGVLLAGLIISAARLARRFQRFWGLGVFTNIYAALFIILGVAVCGIPLTAENALSSIPHLGTSSSWIVDLSGIAATLVLPAIRVKPRPIPAENQVRDLHGISSSNPILAVIEDAIRDRILERMHSKIAVASRRYNWETIKRAASWALEQEMIVRPLTGDEYDAVRQSIDILHADSDPRVDSNNKYEALLRLLRWCSFQRLIRCLDTAAHEAQA